MYLTKSDFALARSCPTRLFYHKSGLRPASAGDEYLRLLAEGGFMIEEIARQLHPGGRTIGYRGTPEEAARLTAEALRAPEAILYEATLIAGRLLARVDVLVKRGSVVELVEVKSGAYDGDQDRALRGEGKPGIFRGKRPPHPVLAGARPYLEDVAFQAWVARQALPEAEVRPFLMLADTSRTISIDGLWGCFSIERSPDGGRPLVRFTGDAARLRADHLLAKVEVAEEVDLLLDEVARAGKVYVGSLFPELRRIEQPLSLHCSGCDLHEEDDDGVRLFPGCWGELSGVRPNLFEMYYVGEIGGRSEPLANRLIADRRIRLFDIEESDLVKADGTVGSRNRRQLVQLRNTRLHREWVSDELPAILDGFAYPLKFIDFETSALAVPYHAGMRPYETVAFQWSCHTLEAPGAAPVHREWINAEDAFPNRTFAESLRATVEDGGTVFMWATHERTTLRTIRAQLLARGEHDPELAAWMEALEERLVDMNDLTLKHYFHPRMKGRTSLKPVCDAVWCSNPRVREAFPEYAAPGGEAVSPYRSLPPIQVAGEPVVVREGTGAIRAYQAMLYGAEAREPEAREGLRRLLLQYCRLDTAAMVMVWMHWRGGA